ncbi:MAG: hypothetical protein ACI9U2_002550 [Bradymonadia bacterium]|jgi:hypothetical protein
MKWCTRILTALTLLVAGCGDDNTVPDVGTSPDDAALSTDAAMDANSDTGVVVDPRTDAGIAEPRAPQTDFAVELGLGHRMFSAPRPGEVAPLQRGCQGAQHVWISLRSVDLMPGDLTNHLQAIRVRDGEVVVPRHTLVLPWDAGATGAELIGVTLVVFDPVAVIGELIDVHVEVEAAGGRVGRAVIRVRVEWGPDAC